MLNFHYLASSIGSQKLGLPVEEFKALKCPIGTAVRVTTPQGCFVCKAYPRTDFKKDATIETTVQLYNQIQKIHLKNHRIGEQDIVQIPVKTATHVTVTIVGETFKDVCNLKQANSQVLLKGILANRIFSSLSSVNVKSCMPAIGVNKVLILKVQPETEALRINAKTQIIIEAIITQKWLELQAKVSSNSLAGVNQEYEKLKELVAFPLQHPEVFRKLRAPKGILLHGPPGCGKSSIAHQLCTEFGLFLVPITTSDLSSSEPGGSEVKLKSIFREASSVDSPTVILLDDVDSICPKKGGQTHTDRLTTCLTNILDDLHSESKLTIIATTSRLDDVDQSLCRPGRLDREVKVVSLLCQITLNTYFL